MNDIGSVSTTQATQVEAQPRFRVADAPAGALSFDASTTTHTATNPHGAPALRAQATLANPNSTYRAVAAVGMSLEYALGAIAALTVEENNKLARTAKDERQAQIRAQVQERLAAADDKREEAMMNVTGSSVGAATQGISAGMSATGGAKGLHDVSKVPVAAPPADAAGNVNAGTGTATDLGTGTPGTADSLASAADLNAGTGTATDLGTGTPGTADSLASAADLNAGTGTATDLGTGTPGTASPGATSTEAANPTVSYSNNGALVAAGAQNLSLLVSGASGGVTAAGEAVKGGFSYIAQIKGAEAEEKQARATEIQANLEVKKELIANVQKNLEDMVQASDQVNESKNQTERNIWAQV